MDFSALKGRIAEALVESIFRQAGYTVSRLGRESQVQRLVKTGSDDFAPDFLVWKSVTSAGQVQDLHQLLTVEVKYRANLAEFLRRDAAELFADARRAWPGLYFVLVTDEPAAGRSCFQGVALREYVGSGGVPATVDLHELPTLGIYRSTVEEHEAAVRSLFAALGSRRPSRKAGTATSAGVTSSAR
jgi:hypothetical protein